MSYVIRIDNNKIQITDLLKCFMQFEDDDRLSPSRYMREVGMTVEERLKFLNDRSRKQRIGRQNKFWTIPDIVVFQNFETHVKYSTTISFMHQKQHPVRIKVFADLSPCFSLKEMPGTVYSKLAPGTPHKMSLDFYSEEYRDYSCFIRFDADDDVVYLPIVAVAPRPIIIFPDEIEMSETVVNISSDKKVFMRNMGKSAVVFKLRAESPFSVCPKTGIMEPNQVLDVKVSYKTFRVEKNISDLVVSFEGVDLSATLKCEAKNCEVYLDKTILHFEDTFLDLQRCTSINLVNRSEYTIKYQWKQFKTKYQDIEQYREFRLKLEGMNEYEVLRNIQEENPNITDAELHKTFLQRIYEDELEEFDSTDQFLFHHPNFKFSEDSGVIGPYSTVNIEVVFSPDKADSYEIIAYLDVTGRETRQPLKMVGSGLGPEVSLNFRILDVENLYLCAKHQYEIVAKNEGHIPATLTYCHKTMDFGGLMSCSPDEVHINPGKCEKMVLEFSSTMQGKFLENLYFRIAESGEYVSCIFQGNVVCPLLSYSIQEVDFGIVAFGFAIEKVVTIQNTTEVPIEFRICVLNDGAYEAITWVNFSMSHDAESVSKMPKEFSIYPDEATVAGNSSITIKITLVPNKARRHSTFLHTYMWGSRKHYVELPIYYNCILPVVECSPPKLDIRYCFINCPYDRMFTLKNISEVPGYILYNDAEEDDRGLSCKLSLTESYIEPGEEIVIHLEIKGLQLGLHTKNLSFTVFGGEPSNLCKLTCDVQGPVICVNPEEIKFGCVPLLKWHSRKLHVMNDSPVQAFISIHVANPTFHVNPNEFKLEASEKLEVDISIYLTNVAKYTSILILNIVNSMDPLKVHISAFGVGSCVLFEPILEPKYDLGTLMTHNTFRIPFKMTNMGKDLQKLYFSRVKDLKSFKEETPTVRGPFMIDPNLFEIQEKEQKIGYVEVFHTIPGPIDLIYYCFTLDKISKFSKVFEVKFTAHFEDPVLLLSRPSLNFRLDVTVDNTVANLQEIYTVTNESYLASDIYVTLQHPFYVIDEHGSRASTLSMNVPSKEEFSFVVEFVPPSGVKKCLVSTGNMRIGFKLHPKIFSIPLTGDVHYPTLFTYPEVIKNQHIAPMAHCSKELIIKNISPLTVAYKYEWEVTSYAIEKLSTPRNNLSTLENSHTLSLEKIDQITIPELTPEMANTNQIIENLTREDDDPITFKLPNMKTIYEALLENVRFPHIHPDVTRKLLNLSKLVLYPITENICNEEDEYTKLLDNMPESMPEINEAMLNITPNQGCLQPYECSLVNFYIRPPIQTRLKATVKCRILGGAEEKIEISAVCADIAYNIDKLEVYFGNQLFCEPLEEQINLYNTGHVGFVYAVLDDSNTPKPKITMDAAAVGLLTVTPNMGTLEPNGSVALQIKYFPGIIGDFNESFVIEIGYLGPVSVQVTGTAVYAQLYIMLPRPSLFETAESYICYVAIGYLTKDPSNIHYDMKNVCEDIELDDISKEILEKDDWFIVDYEDVDIPSSVDIDMAIERMVGYEYLLNNPQLFGERASMRKKHFTIPNYIVPTYELSFGNVRRDGQYEQDVSVYNYGPTICLVKLFINDKKSLEYKGFFVDLDCQRIRLKEFANLNVKFKPDSKGADFSQPFVSEVIYLEVNQGARIPIRISASVGIPTTELSVQCMDFCGVVVGNCKRKTICLHNVGFVEAKWTCSIDTPIFFVREREGLLAAGESEDIHVFFEPKARGPRQGVMTIRVEGNSEDLTAYLNGYGREPSFIIKESVVQFPPVLQYSPPLEETFLIQNASSFPTEVFMCDYDRQISLHERICNVFWGEKNAKKVYVARSLYGSTPSDIYRYLYKEMLLDRLRREKSFTEVMMLSKTDIRGSSQSVERLLDNLELRVDSSIVRKKPPQDIFMDADIEDDKPVVERTTKIIVFHGNKYTDYLKAANDASRALNIPRYTLDAMIIDILVENSTAFTKEVNQIIDDAFLIRMEPDDCLCRESFIEDDTEGMWRKLNAILSLEPVSKIKAPPKKEGKEKTEKNEQMSMTSSKISRKTISTNTADTFQGIPEEMLVQILSDKLDHIDKMILDSLESIFLPNVQIALKCFLKAAKDITCVYFVFFTCTLEEHNALETEEEVVNAAREEDRRQMLHKKLLDLDDYTTLSEEEQGILIAILEEKRKRCNEKRTELRSRIQDDLIQSAQNQKSSDLKTFWSYLDNSYFRNQNKLPSKSIKIAETQHQHSATLLTKDSKETKESKTRKDKKKDKTKDTQPADDTSFYYYQYDVMLSEMLFLLENWNRKELEMEKVFPNFASLMASNRKDAKYTSKEFLKKMDRTKSKTSGGFSFSIPENIDEFENVVKTSFDPLLGYPVWLVNQAHKKRSVNVIDPIIELLKKMITINCLSSSKKSCKETETLYTVLNKPTQRKYKEKLDVFDLVKCEPRGDSSKTEAPATPTPTNEEEGSFAKTSNTAMTRRKARKRKLTLTPTASEIEQINNISARFQLEPSSIQEVTVVFKPLYCGFFKYSYNFEVVGTYYREKVIVQASCDYPRIDTSPYTLFPHRVQNIDSKTMFLNGVYVISHQLLEFGTILLIPQNLLEMKSSISMLNTSGMLCETRIAFKNDTKVFYCDEEQTGIEIKPGRQNVLTIFAKPPTEGPVKDTLLITIKNNPRVQEINLSCFACPLKFEVTPKHVNFNKVILGKTESEKIFLKNSTAVMVYFEFDVDITSDFKLSTFNGYLDPCSSLEVTVTFIPEIIGDRKETLVLKVFDKEKQFPEPIYTAVLTLLAEVATFPLEYATSIDLGLVKGKIPHYFPFTINNTGKYDVKILLTKPNLQGYNVVFGECFKMKHMEYVVEGNSNYSNNCRFTCDREVAFSDLPVVHVTILDNYRNSAIDHFTFLASARVTLSKFELCPHGEYFFGYQNVNTIRSSLLTLKNIGDFEFKYTIMTPRMIEEQSMKKQIKKESVVVNMEEAERVSSIPSLSEGLGTQIDRKSLDKSIKSTTDAKRKAKLRSKSRSATLLAGIVTESFTITPSSGIVLPGESVSITIDSRPTECEKYKETVVFFVSEPSYEDRKGRRLNLHVEGTEPRINFNDHIYMFPLQYVVTNIEDLPHVGENYVFETSKKLLHFGKIALNNVVSTKFRVPNTGHVTATVNYEIADSESGFSIRSKAIDIAPYKSEFNEIEFAPRAIGIWTGVLEMKCLGFSNGKEISCSINLMGEACMPTIEILHPDCSINGENTQCCFGPIPVKSSCQRSVVIRNSGHVLCKAVVEIIGDPNWFLTLSLKSESGGDEQDFEKCVKKHSDVLTLKIGEKGYINVDFEAKMAACTDAILNIIVMNNCFDVWKLHLNTFAFDAMVCLEDLPVVLIKNKKIAYCLDFGPVNRNDLYKIYFKVRNISDSVYKFEFEQMEELIFSPCAGHLYEGSEKTIIAAFRTKHHINCKEREVPLIITEIKLHPGHIFPLPWDERQDSNIVVFKCSTADDSNENPEPPSFENAVHESIEPPFDYIGDPTVMSLIVNAQCGYANYFCETREMCFPPTYMHTVLSKTICIENKSEVNLEINWTLADYLDSKDIPSAPRPSLFDKMQVTEESDLLPTKPEADSQSFLVEPKAYVIPPKKEYTFKISFIPVDHKVYEYFLKANMKNLDPETADLEIVLKGESQSFPYHMSSSFIEDFDSSDCRFRTYCGLLSSVENKILNFLSLGVGSECNRTIFITNNTHNPFSFVWHQIRIDPENASFFHCEFNKGYVSPGKTTKTNFVFIPQFHGLFTDCFQFEPDDPYMPRCSLLLQGICREPKVFFEYACVPLGVSLLNNLVEKEIILRNDEDLKIHFSFKKNSLFSENQQKLIISPMSGLMESKSEHKLRISVRTTKEGETIFSPKCVVQHMSKPINFNLLMNVVNVTSKLIYFGRELSQIEVRPSAPLIVNLGVIAPHKREELKFELCNTSTVGLYYSWITKDKQKKAKIQFSRKEGYLKSSEKLTFIVSLQALRKCIFKNISLKLKILYGPTYIFRVEASTEKPKFTFSFVKYDFGKCLIQEEQTKFYHIPLVFTNNNKWPVILEYAKNNIPEFAVDFKSAEVEAEQTSTIEIFFSPMENTTYEAALHFYVDSKKIIIKLSGEGVPLVLEVLSLSEKFLDFGKVRVGKSVEKSVRVLNAGESIIDVFFAIQSNLPFNKKIEKETIEFCIENPTKPPTPEESPATDAKASNKKKGKTPEKSEKEEKITPIKDQRALKMSSKEKLNKDSNKTRLSGKNSRSLILKSIDQLNTDSEMQLTNSKDNLNKFLLDSIEVYPKKMVRMMPKKTIDVIVKFKPKESKETFQSNIFFQVQNYRGSILTIMGSAVDACFTLNKEVINFGNVVVGYASEESIILMNESYIGGKFHWHLQKNSSYISFIGGDGYCPPNSKVTTTIIFKPRHVQCVFKFKAYCQIENYKKRLELILTGGSMNLPPPLETFQFTAAVREECYQEIEFQNNTTETWETEPVFTGSYFSGPTVLRVPKESSIIYQVVYCPMKMNPSFHKGTVFFPLQNGMNRLYALEGVVTPPNPVAELSREICCKTYHSEILKVENWLGLRQQFRVITESLEAISTRMIYKITSNDHFEVPPYGKRDFKWTIYVLNEGKLSFKVTFINEKTKEFLYYVIRLKISPIEFHIENIQFATCVRIPVIKNIVIKNPLPEALDYIVTASSPYIIVPSSFIAQPYEKYDFSVKYLPVKVESTTAVLTISNPAVGNYTYNLILEAHSPNSEPEVQVRTQLGQSASKIINLPRLVQGYEVSGKIEDSTSFEIVRINSQSDPYIELLFLPSKIGRTRAALQVTSLAGEYTYPLVGECVLPEPQGPFSVTLGESISIEIYNPFEETMLFRFGVDNNVFHVKPTEESIKAKTSMKITITASVKRLSKLGSMTSMSESVKTGLLTGKLTVVCENELKWIYYLQCQAANK